MSTGLDWNEMVFDVHKELALKAGVIYDEYASHNDFVNAAIAVGCSRIDAMKEVSRRRATADKPSVELQQVALFLEGLSQGDRKQFLQQITAPKEPISLELFCKKYLADKASAEAAEVAQAAWVMADKQRDKYTIAQEKLKADKIAVEELRKEWIRLTENASGLQEVADSIGKVE
jgi:hypothetical protein